MRWEDIEDADVEVLLGKANNDVPRKSYETAQKTMARLDEQKFLHVMELETNSRDYWVY